MISDRMERTKEQKEIEGGIIKKNEMTGERQSKHED